MREPNETIRDIWKAIKDNFAVFAWISMLLVLVNLPTGPRFGRIILVTQVLAIGLVGVLILSPAKKRLLPSQGVVVFVVACAAVFSFGVLISSQGIMDVVQSLRKLVIIPSVFFFLGFLLSQRDKYVAIIPILASALVALAMMALAIKSTPKGIHVYGVGWTGEESRIFFDFFDKTVWYRGPGVLTQCFAAALCGACWPLVSNRLMRIALFVATVAYMAMGLYVGTRTGTILVAAAVGGIWVTRVLGGGNQTRIFLMLFAGFIAMVGGLILVSWLAQVSPARVERFLPENLFDFTLAGRTQIWADRISDIAQNPKGIGMASALDYNLKSSHNMYLESLLSFGYIGGGAFWIFWIGFFIYGIRRYFSDFGSPYASAFGAFVTLVICYGAIESLFVSSYVMYQLVFYGTGIFFGIDVARRGVRPAPLRQR